MCFYYSQRKKPERGLRTARVTAVPPFGCKRKMQATFGASGTLHGDVIQRRTHSFKEWYINIQKTGSADVPEEVIERILAEVNRNGSTHTGRITYSMTRGIMKTLGMQKHYDQINYIVCLLNGIPVPRFTPELEDTLFAMFRQTQEPFIKHCPPERKNYLPYVYVLAKLLEILGLHGYLGYFQHIKSREKICAQDALWSKITAELGWPFYPTLT